MEFKRDFIFKLLTNLVRIPVSFILQSIFPRILGPASYGSFDFLTDSANKFIGFFETGTSIAFYTNLSKDNYDKIIVKFYWVLVSVISLIYLLFVGFITLVGSSNTIWPDQKVLFIVLSAFWGVLTYIANSSLKMLDACHITVSAERFRMLQLGLSVLVFSVFYFFFNTISLTLFFYIQLFLITVLIIGSGVLLRRKGIALFPMVNLSKEDYKKWIGIFWDFSNPLIIYSLFSLLAGIGDRWILQSYGGTIQQAYFGISFKVGTFVFLFTSAMMPLLMREFSKLHGTNNLDQIRSIFGKNIKILYFIASILAILVAFNADFITLLLGGSEFKEASAVVALMAFYPIHQTLGQINGVLYYSTNRTKQYRNFGMSIMPFGLLLSYFLIAPKIKYGLELGAIGLAYQMVLIQLVSVNLLLFFNCKYLKVSFFSLLKYQTVVMLLMISVGYILKLILLSFITNLLINCIVFTLLFSALLLIAIIVYPKIVGIKNREDLLLEIRTIFSR